MADKHEYVPDCECHDCLRVTVRKRDVEITELKAQASALVSELSVIREVVSDCSFAIGTGAFLKPEASIHIMRELPSEIRKTIAMLKSHAFMADDECNTVRRMAQEWQEELAALRARAVPDGFMLVPKEPTSAMVTAGADQVSDYYDDGNNQYHREIARFGYRAMLAASKETK